MIYGMYLSATGVLTNAYRQDVIANNIANSETVGFKRDLAEVRQRPSAAAERGGLGFGSDPLLSNIDSGMFLSPTQIDMSPGESEPTGNDMDVAIQGDGYFAVQKNGQTHLTRNGQFQRSGDGHLVLSNDPSQNVLDSRQNPIQFDSTAPITIGRDGTVTQNGKTVATVGLFNVPEGTQLKKDGLTLMSAPAGANLRTSNATLRSGFAERSNVEPATELTSLMEAQRELEANANMIKTQDETLDKLVNDVGRVS
jgi:flagellar basal-body rod protein FlgF